jgi:hypothetical protein
MPSRTAENYITHSSVKCFSHSIIRKIKSRMPNLMLSSHLHIGLPSDHFPRNFLTKLMYEFLISLIWLCLTHHNLTGVTPQKHCIYITSKEETGNVLKINKMEREKQHICEGGNSILTRLQKLRRQTSFQHIQNA